MKECLSTQILLEFLYGHYIISSDKVSLKSMGDTSGGSLVSRLLKSKISDQQIELIFSSEDRSVCFRLSNPHPHTHPLTLKMYSIDLAAQSRHSIVVRRIELNAQQRRIQKISEGTAVCRRGRRSWSKNNSQSLFDSVKVFFSYFCCEK